MSNDAHRFPFLCVHRGVGSQLAPVSSPIRLTPVPPHPGQGDTLGYYSGSSIGLYTCLIPASRAKKSTTAKTSAGQQGFIFICILKPLLLWPERTKLHLSVQNCTRTNFALNSRNGWHRRNCCITDCPCHIWILCRFLMIILKYTLFSLVNWVWWNLRMSEICYNHYPPYQFEARHEATLVGDIYYIPG